jgi:hypothetical protein
VADDEIACFECSSVAFPAEIKGCLLAQRFEKGNLSEGLQL